VAGIKSSEIFDLWARGICVGGLFSSHVLATLPRAAYIYFIVPQLILANIYLLWVSLNCRQY
jgi:hypothetical protein